MKLYRGTSRGPQKIIESEGFQPKLDLSVEAVRALILEYCGYNNSGKNPLDLSRLIISSPQGDTVSSARDEDCGGYSNEGFVYELEVEGLEEKEWSNEVLGFDLNVKGIKLYPKLYLDADTLAEATIIAVEHFGNSTAEVSFFTSIALENITGWRTSSGTSFQKLSNAE